MQSDRSYPCLSNRITVFPANSSRVNAGEGEDSATEAGPYENMIEAHHRENYLTSRCLPWRGA